MVGNSKILTVSYGTFACTLEGFDDSFDTMKAIAEYFRDLAADDRYFGAEPPSPDAEMLTRIAEREIARRVEAHSSAGQIHLRASPATLPEPAPAPVQPPPQPAHMAPPAAAAFPDMAPLPEPAAPLARYNDTDSISDKLRRIRAVAAPGSSAFPGDDLSEAACFPDEAEAEPPLPKDETPLPVSHTYDQTAEIPSGAMSEDVATGDSEAPQAAEVTETAEDTPDSRILTRLSARSAESAQDRPEPAESPQSEIDSDELSMLLRSAEAFDAAEQAADEPDTAAAETDVSEQDILSQLLSDTIENTLGSADEPEPVEPATDLEMTELAQLPEPEPSPVNQPLAARVIKLKRRALDALIAAGTLPKEWAKTSDQPEQQISSPQETALTDAPAPSDEAPEAHHSGPAVSVSQAARIFDEADTQLGQPDSSERRRAIQHLRAAVAATRAEQHAGGTIQANIDDRPYRDDLQKAVQPSRPRPPATTATPRPSPETPLAPLTLVAEQRVDAPMQPVRPRRITSADLITLAELRRDAASDQAARQSGQIPPSELFDFTRQMGANSLIERLEAAAAYMTDIEGVSQFTRSMLIQKLHEAHEGAVPREESLHSFGQLLRQGRLQKLRGGWFSVSATTGFRAPAAAARMTDS